MFQLLLVSQGISQFLPFYVGQCSKPEGPRSSCHLPRVYHDRSSPCIVAAHSRGLWSKSRSNGVICDVHDIRLYDFLEYFVILMFSISPVSTAEVVSAVYFCWAICMKTAPHVGGSSIRLPCWDLRQYSLELQAQFRDVKRHIVEGGVCV